MSPLSQRAAPWRPFLQPLRLNCQARTWFQFCHSSRWEWCGENLAEPHYAWCVIVKGAPLSRSGGCEVHRVLKCDFVEPIGSHVAAVIHALDDRGRCYREPEYASEPLRRTQMSLRGECTNKTGISDEEEWPMRESETPGVLLSWNRFGGFTRMSGGRQ